MINLLIQYMFLLAPLVIHLIHDVQEINSKVSPKHGRNLVILGVLALFFAYFNSLLATPRVDIWQYLLYAFGLHFVFFNYLLNFLRKPRVPMFHLGTGPFDRVYQKIIDTLSTGGYMFIQLIVLLGTFMNYHFPQHL